MPRPAAAPADRPAAAAPSRRPGLRGLPAGYDLDRLPLAVPPVADEQAAGWLSRVAHRYGLTPHALLTAIGAPTPSYNLRTVARHLHRHTEQVTGLLGSAPPGRSSADVGFLDGALAGYQHAYAGGVGRWPSGSRFCPACLTGMADDVDRCGEGTGPDSALRRRPHNGLLAALRLGVADDAGGLSPAGQLTFRVGSGRPRYPEPALWCGLEAGSFRGGQLPLRVVPQLLWPGLLTDHLTDAESSSGRAGGSDPARATVMARACAAMFLARLGSTRPWHLIALELGLPAWFADCPAALHRRLVQTGRWLAFLADLDALADRLQAAPPPIDYRTRRWLCTDPPRLLAAVRAARTLTDTALPAGLSDELLARMFWQVYTGGDLLLAHPPLGRSLPTQPGGDVDASPIDEEPCVPSDLPRIFRTAMIGLSYAATGVVVQSSRASWGVL